MTNQLNFRHPSPWIVLGCISLLQVINGTRYTIFPTCKEQCYFSNVQHNYVLVALEIGKLFGFLSAAAADHLPAPMILAVGLVFGLIGYGGQYLLITNKIPLMHYWQVLLLSCIAGNSSCWVSTYCYVLAIRNFRDWHATIIAITSSYSSLCSRLYSILVEGIQGRKVSKTSSTYLLLTCFLPTTTGFGVVVISYVLKFIKSEGFDMSPIAFFMAILIGVYLIIQSALPIFSHLSSRLRAMILGLVLILPFVIALIVAIQQFTMQKLSSQLMLEKPKIVMKEVEIGIDHKERDVNKVIKEEKKNKLGLKEELMNVDFWLFYLVNACGATLAMVYMINLEKISDSSTNNGPSFLLEISSTFTFFGRISSVMLKWCTSYNRTKSVISNPALTVLLMLPMPIAFFLLLINDSNKLWLYISTGILGSCSGALNSMSATTMYQLFGRNHFVAKQTIAQTNVPLGFLLFGWLAATNYEKEGEGSHGICFGQQCYTATFFIWGSFSFVGTILSFVLYLRSQDCICRSDDVC